MARIVVVHRDGPLALWHFPRSHLTYGKSDARLWVGSAVKSDPRELDLVKEAIKARVTGCCEWEEEEARRVMRDYPELGQFGLTPKGIKILLIQHVERTGQIEQKPEERHPWKDEHDFWYRALIDIEDVPKPLFVEVRFIQGGPTLPVVRIVSAHF
jgi:hypothetical protein